MLCIYLYSKGSATEGKCSLQDDDDQGTMECTLDEEFMIMVGVRGRGV